MASRFVAMLTRTLERGARDLARTVVPVCCPGCGQHDVPWCQECATPWWDSPRRVESGAGRLEVSGRPPLPVWALTELAGPTHGMVAAWKDADRRDLDDFFAQAMTRCALQVAATLAGVPRPVMVVPVPARASSTRARGIDLPALLATAAARGLTRGGVAATTQRCLMTAGHGARQLTARERWRGARAQIRLAHAPPPGTTVVLVDDVITSGATLAASVQALEDCSAAVMSGLTLAATPLSYTRASVGLG